MKSNPRLLILIFAMTTIVAVAQVDLEDKAGWKERIYTGGGGGFSAGSSGYGKFFVISVSPIAGYMLTRQASVGMGITYQYTSYSEIDLTYSMYGINPFVRYNFKELFLTAEYNYLSIPAKPFNPNNSERIFRDRLLVGAGYAVPAGRRGRINAMALYDVLYQPGNGFSSPWVFRVFLSF